MQPPTCKGIRIRSTHDAHRIIRAVELGILPITQRRLDGEERKALRSGDVWVWEERGTGSDNTGLGIERWTDGRTYGPSRVRDDFLFYSERDLEPFQPSAPYANYQNAESLVKQTYSVFIRERSGHQKKWHITAYFSQATVDDLATVDHMPAVARLPVPEGRYASARSNKHKESRSYYAPYSPSQSSAASAAYSPRMDNRPPTSSGISTSPRSNVRMDKMEAARLVPLKVLQNPPLSPVCRNPEDEKALRSLSYRS